jgi:hypothetical protein
VIARRDAGRELDDAEDGSVLQRRADLSQALVGRAVVVRGKPSVVQTSQAVAPGRPEKTFFETSSILTIARPCASWPVITRRT